MAKTKAAKTKDSGSMGFAAKLGLFLTCAAGIVFLRQAFLLPLMGLLPSAVAYITDRWPGRPLFQSVLACNLCGVAYYLIEFLMRRGTDNAALHRMLLDGKVWLVMYGTAGLGYGVYYAAPVISLFTMRLVNRGKLMRLQSIQDKLRRDWGPTIENEDPAA